VKLDHMAHDGQTRSQSGALTLGAGIALSKPIKDIGQ
jgi:hypothetical protein